MIELIEKPGNASSHPFVYAWRHEENHDIQLSSQTAIAITEQNFLEKQ